MAIDEGHNNFHTADGRYLHFARLLRADGYVVKGYIGEFRKSQLKNVRLLVIANALNKINVQNWYLPTPSAFTVKETEILQKWVKAGGSLFLVADHMPMGGAATDLAAAQYYSLARREDGVNVSSRSIPSFFFLPQHARTAL